MSPVLPVVSSLYAVVLALFAVVLTVRVILGRVRTGIQAGDGGDPALAQAIRAHGNFTEQVPIALLVLVLLDATATSAVVVHALGAALVVARLISAWGLSRSLGATTQRQAGAGLTALVITGGALLLAWRVLPLLLAR